jgi:hypothetical protein
MTPNAKHSAFFLIVFLLIAVSCIKEEVGNIEEGIVITPFYSLPIGSTELLFDEIVDNPGFDTIPADTALSPDSVFVFNGREYLLPPAGFVDTVLYEFYDFSGLQEFVDHATYVMFRLNIENAIPAGIVLQVTFLDAGFNPLFSLFNEPGLDVEPAPDNGSFILSPYDTDPLTESEIQLLPAARVIRVYFGLSLQSLADGAYYSSEQFFHLQMGVRVGLERNIGE